MDQARSTISKIFNGEPHSYTRFNLTQNMEGDNSQVEMKLSSDMEEGAAENGVGNHLNHSPTRRSMVVQKLERTPKNICFLAGTTLLIFIIGYLIGYLVHRKKDLAPTTAAAVLPFDDKYEIPSETGAAPLMNWADVKRLLAEKLGPSKFEETFRDLERNDHRAGSPGDDSLGNKVVNRFKLNGIKYWTDDHFIKVQEAAATALNKVTFKGRKEAVTGFLSYSATGTATGPVLYAYYGQENDFMLLSKMNINMTGRVILVRAGNISLAEKVANAAKMNAAAVLIYPDQADYPMADDTELYGHVHMGSGDPYTPGFPSFNHTQFPQVQSSGLPSILAQTITARMATNIMRQLGGQPVNEWGGIRLGNESDVVTVEVNNVLTEKKITNIFGVIEGFVDSDRYVVIGAKRDAWGPGFASSTVGTGVLLELARSISEMVKNDRFKPRRSIVFASWSGGEYGSVGATEWLEGYLSSLSMKAFSYINLDGAVTGLNGFKVSGSPLMHRLVENTLKEVNSPVDATSLYLKHGGSAWEKNVWESLKTDSAAYPFLAFSGIPSVSFRFTSNSGSQSTDYLYFGTMLDTRDKLNLATSTQTEKVAVAAAQFAGQIALRLVHDYVLQMDLQKYDSIIRGHVVDINKKVSILRRVQPNSLPQGFTMQWLFSAYGSFSRAFHGLKEDLDNSVLDIEMCRIINDRIMTVERNFLSPYASPNTNPFRHVFLGSGPHTIKALIDHLGQLNTKHPEADVIEFRNQFALATWTIQACANSLAGDIWSLNNQI
ncbi:transferrin receptor protein 1-like [Genypterus blacodes]|uniref:transferrin receptor protein 1-like n=1 Tax=Genypterus blacodes TaxID=154954 RepID=UPI003F75A41A